MSQIWNIFFFHLLAIKIKFIKLLLNYDILRKKISEIEIHY